MFRSIPHSPKETCNPAGRFLVAKTPREIGDLVAALWGMESDDGYEAVLDILVGKVGMAPPF